jgi:hypothetical protein
LQDAVVIGARLVPTAPESPAGSCSGHAFCIDTASCFRAVCSQDAVVIGARLDSNSSGESCRLAFYGRLLAQLGSGTPQELKRLLVFKVHPTLDSRA